MDQDNRKIAVEECLTFFGQITAGISHEVNNVNAIIRELAGLMDDLLYGADQSGQVNIDKFKEIVRKIVDQTKRGEKNIKRLNTFSHCVDHPAKIIKLDELIIEITDLSQRFARLKYVTLTAEQTDYSCEIKTNPFLLQYAIFSCIDLLINSADEHGKIMIGFTMKNGFTNILITGAIRKEDEKNPERLETINRLMKELNGEFSRQKNDENIDVLSLKIPGSGI